MARAAYRIEVDRDGLQLEIDERFWSEKALDDDGTTQLDFNIASVIEEIRAALYYVGTKGPRH